MSKTIEVSDETYEKIKDKLTKDEAVELETMDDFVGKKWFIRTVTYHLVGNIKKRVGNFFVLEDATVVFDSGRFMNAIKEGTLSEVEPVGEALVHTNAITDMFPWKHNLPTEQK
jgi:hypothetical protein